VLLAKIPFSQYLYAPCVLAEQERATVRARWPGFVDGVHVRDGDWVSRGQLVAVCTNEELGYGAVETEQELVIARIRLAGFEKENNVAGAQAESYRIQALEETLGVLRDRVASLRLTAPCAGRVIAPDIHNALGRFLAPGAPLAILAREPFSRIIVVMDQAGIADVQRVRDREVEVRFESGPTQTIRCRITKVLPQATHEVPGHTHLAGGPIVLDPSAPEGDRTLLPWFCVELELPPGAPAVPLGTTGRVRFEIARRPLVEQWYYKLLRLLRTRYVL